MFSYKDVVSKQVNQTNQRYSSWPQG